MQSNTRVRCCRLPPRPETVRHPIELTELSFNTRLACGRRGNKLGVGSSGGAGCRGIPVRSNPTGVLSSRAKDRIRPTGRSMGGRRRRPLAASATDRFFVAIVELGPKVRDRVQSDPELARSLAKTVSTRQSQTIRWLWPSGWCSPPATVSDRLTTRVDGTLATVVRVDK